MSKIIGHGKNPISDDIFIGLSGDIEKKAETTAEPQQEAGCLQKLAATIAKSRLGFYRNTDTKQTEVNAMPAINKTAAVEATNQARKYVENAFRAIGVKTATVSNGDVLSISVHTTGLLRKEAAASYSTICFDVKHPALGNKTCEVTTTSDGKTISLSKLKFGANSYDISQKGWAHLLADVARAKKKEAATKTCSLIIRQFSRDYPCGIDRKIAEAPRIAIETLLHNASVMSVNNLSHPDYGDTIQALLLHKNDAAKVASIAAQLKTACDNATDGETAELSYKNPADAQKKAQELAAKNQGTDVTTEKDPDTGDTVVKVPTDKNGVKIAQQEFPSYAIHLLDAAANEAADNAGVKPAIIRALLLRAMDMGYLDPENSGGQWETVADAIAQLLPEERGQLVKDPSSFKEFMVQWAPPAFESEGNGDIADYDDEGNAIEQEEKDEFGPENGFQIVDPKKNVAFEYFDENEEPAFNQIAQEEHEHPMARFMSHSAQTKVPLEAEGKNKPPTKNQGPAGINMEIKGPGGTQKMWQNTKPTSTSKPTNSGTVDQFMSPENPDTGSSGEGGTGGFDPSFANPKIMKDPTVNEGPAGIKTEIKGPGGTQKMWQNRKPEATGTPKDKGTVDDFFNHERTTSSGGNSKGTVDQYLTATASLKDFSFPFDSGFADSLPKQQSMSKAADYSDYANEFLTRDEQDKVLCPQCNDGFVRPGEKLCPECLSKQCPSCRSFDTEKLPNGVYVCPTCGVKWQAEY